ncbi:MAG: DUF4082 domain-containing protein, partial [Spartobacteria bacterium]
STTPTPQSVTKALSIVINAASTTPILIITNSANPFSSYYPEILSTEGLNEFDTKEVSTLTGAILAPYQVAIVGEGQLTPSQVTILTDWVNSGGNLIAFRPDKQLGNLLGLIDQGSTLAEGYLLVDQSATPGLGIVAQTIQYHGTADRYALGTATSVATLYSTAQTATVNPAVTINAVGSNGGHAAAFTYDLARSVVYTRQGNPAWAGQDRDGNPPIRPDDMFYGAASFDPKPDWVDRTKVAIPQADEQQRLLANIIIFLNANRTQLPRFWYFPHSYKSAVVMTGDDHANGGTAPRFDEYLAASVPGASVDDWEAVRSTSYIYPGSPLTDAQVAAYVAQGFEISLHLNTGCSDYTSLSLSQFFTDQLAQLYNQLPSLSPIETHRIHCIVWSDYSMPAEISRQFGIRLDTSYYYWPASWVANTPGLFTGSAMPMRFAGSAGDVIDVYQATTQMTDESGQAYPATCDTLLDRAIGFEGYYGAFVANMHTDVGSSPGSDAIVASAISRGIPIISSRQLLTWLDARNASKFSSVSSSGTTETFSVTVDPLAKGLTAMVPIPPGYGVTEITQNGGLVAFAAQAIKGVQYAFFSAVSGDYIVNFGVDQTPPTVLAVEPLPNQTSVPISGARITATFSESMSAGSINTDSFTLKDSSGATVAATVAYNGSNGATLTPSGALASGVTYSVTVTGGSTGVSDASGNPLASDYVWSFTTATGYSIWSGTTVPSLVDVGPDSSVELGLKFKSDVAGTISGIRFYKSVANTGSHFGNLWSSTGTLLAMVTFTNETASGWQQADFTTPVAIASNTTYVASYHASVGHYSDDSYYFSTSGMDNPPLHALASEIAGGNGVYAYGAGNLFPNQTYNSGNYWVDVVFSPSPP